MSILKRGNTGPGRINTGLSQVYSGSSPLLNNQSSNVAINGLLFESSVTSFNVLITANVLTSGGTDTFETFTLEGIKSSTFGWTMSISSIGDVTNVNFIVGNSFDGLVDGQVYYTSPDFGVTFSSGIFRYNATKTFASGNQSLTSLPLTQSIAYGFNNIQVLGTTDNTALNVLGGVALTANLNAQSISCTGGNITTSNLSVTNSFTNTNANYTLLKTGTLSINNYLPRYTYGTIASTSFGSVRIAQIPIDFNNSPYRICELSCVVSLPGDSMQIGKTNIIDQPIGGASEASGLIYINNFTVGNLYATSSGTIPTGVMPLRSEVFCKITIVKPNYRYVSADPYRYHYMIEGTHSYENFFYVATQTAKTGTFIGQGYIYSSLVVEPGAAVYSDGTPVTGTGANDLDYISFKSTAAGANVFNGTWSATYYM
jgi:hypothetical protein